MDGFSLSVASYVVKVKVWKFNYKRMCKNQRKSWPFLRKRPTFVELLTRFELVTSSLPTAMAIFFVYFSLVYSRFCSISFAFRHSLQTGFPYIPRLSVAGYVVRNPCGT